MAGKGARHRLGMSQTEYAEKLERILGGSKDDQEPQAVVGSTSATKSLKTQPEASEGYPCPNSSEL